MSDTHALARSHSVLGFVGAGGVGGELLAVGGGVVEGMLGCQVPALAVGVNAGLLLSALVVCMSRIFSLSLLATARGGASFLCPKRQRNEAKKTLSPPYPKCPQRAVLIHGCPKSTVLARATDV